MSSHDHSDFQRFCGNNSETHLAFCLKCAASSVNYVPTKVGSRAAQELTVTSVVSKKRDEYDVCVCVCVCKEKIGLDLLYVQCSEVPSEKVLRIALLQCYITEMTRCVCVCVFKPMWFKCPSGTGAH